MNEVGKDGRFIKGMIPWNKDKKLSLEHRAKLAKAKIGYIPWNTGTKGLVKPNSGSFQPGKDHVNYGKSGEGTTNWQGGLTDSGKIIRESEKYNEWRTQIFIRDNYTCQECKSCGCYLNAHHINPLHKILKENNITNFEEALLCSELWDISNGKTLCEECHKNISTRR